MIEKLKKKIDENTASIAALPPIEEKNGKKLFNHGKFTLNMEHDRLMTELTKAENFQSSINNSLLIPYDDTKEKKLKDLCMNMYKFMYKTIFALKTSSDYNSIKNNMVLITNDCTYINIITYFLSQKKIIKINYKPKKQFIELYTCTKNMLLYDNKWVMLRNENTNIEEEKTIVNISENIINNVKLLILL